MARVEGMARLMRRAREVQAGMEAASTDAQREASAEIAREWVAGVPVDSGELRDSIEADEHGAHTDVPYAPLVRSRAGQQAAANVGRRFDTLVGQRIRAGIGRWLRR